MVQYGILLMVVVMKINLKKVVAPIRGGLWWRVPGGTSADLGTECPGVHNVDGYCSLNLLKKKY